MKSAQLAALRILALLFILPGLAGLIVSAMISTHYLEVMPRGPVLVEGRIVPREIHGIVVYQTADVNRQLNLIEYTSVGVLSASDWVLSISKNGAACNPAPTKKTANSPGKKAELLRSAAAGLSAIPVLAAPLQ
jgi:hypothetical protein